MVLIVSSIAAWIVIAFLTIALLAIGRAHGELTHALQDLETRFSARFEEVTGHAAPEFRLPTLDKRRTVSLRDLEGHPSLLVFLSPTCNHCHEVIRQLSSLMLHWQQKGGIALGISNGDIEQMIRMAAKLEANFTILSEDKWHVSQQFQVRGTPWGVAISADGIVRSAGAIESIEGLQALMDAAVLGKSAVIDSNIKVSSFDTVATP